MTSIKNTEIFILAGGKSSRMGTEKGLVNLNGQTFVSHILEAVKKLDIPVSIISENKLYDEYNIPLIVDEIKDKGPLAGIYTGLLHAKKDFAFFLSCDIPFVSAELLKFLSEQNRGQSEVLIPLDKGQAQPLCGLYSKKIAEKIRTLLDNNETGVLKALTHFNTAYIEISQEAFYNEKLLMNINSPDEKAKAENSSLEISVNLYGVLTEITGSSLVKIKTNKTIKNLRTELTRIFPEFQKTDFVIAVNNEICTEEKTIDAKCKIDCMPPFAGG